MSFIFKQQLPGPDVVKAMMPMTEEMKKTKADRDVLVRNIFEGKDDRFLMIIGPCSADNEDSVIDYVGRLARLQEQVADKIVMVPRIYTNKPRTTGEGYKGMVHQPDAEGESDMLKGILAIRKLHMRSISECGLPAADEMLYPENYDFLSDLLGYVAIGARSVENQQHRLTISGLDIPSGMKNPTSGDISVMLNAIKAAQIGHNFIYRNYEVETQGNPLSHAIMRGYVDPYGRNIPNYHYEDIMYLIEQYKKRELDNPAIIIDLNHSNSNKCYNEQPRIAREVVRNRAYDSEMKQFVKGIMVESYIEEGRQEIGGGVYGKSITDPCLGWNATEEMVLMLADRL